VNLGSPNPNPNPNPNLNPNQRALAHELEGHHLALAAGQARHKLASHRAADLHVRVVRGVLRATRPLELLLRVGRTEVVRGGRLESKVSSRV
jgi:hypothetical protein